MNPYFSLLVFAVSVFAKPFTRLLGERPMREQTNETCNVLALSGGGSFGAVEMGILDGLLEANGAPNQFDIITGISAGGLNAAFLSYYSDVSTALPDMYSILSNLTTGSVYKSAFLNIFTEWSIYDNAPLEATLTTILSNKLPSAPTPITLVGATNVNSETLDVFQFDTLTLSDRIDVLMATTAIPLAFPPRTINGSIYVDGGVINNEMISQAMGMKPCAFYKVLFISATFRGERQVINGFFSYVSAIGHVLLDTFDYQIAQYETVHCLYPKGQIQACFPTSPELDTYSILNFDYGAELYALGKSGFNCTLLDIC